MIVPLSTLEKGDEILIGTQGGLRYLKLLQTPRIGKRVHWRHKTPMYSSVKCLTNMEVTPIQTTRWTQQGSVPHTIYNKRYIVSADDLNTEIRVDLEEKDCWLIKKHDEF